MSIAVEKGHVAQKIYTSTRYFYQRRQSQPQDNPHQEVHQFDVKQKKRKIRTSTGMRRYLIREQGFEFVPKNRVLRVPEGILEQHSPYEMYLRRSTYFDPFHEDHVARKNWQKSQEEIVNPKLLNDICVNGNQFTGNSITGVLTYSQYLVRKYRKTNESLASDIHTIYQFMKDAYEGKQAESMYTEENVEERYRFLPYKEKLQLVYTFSDAIAQVLWTIAHDTTPSVKHMLLRVTGKPRRKKEAVLIDTMSKRRSNI